MRQHDARAETTYDEASVAALSRDPRYPQIAVLVALLAYGAIFLDFVLAPLAVPVTFASALLLEHVLARYRGRRSPAYPSAMITACSTLLLFRSNHAWAYAAVVAIAIGSKVALRIDGRHFVNPTNGGVLIGSLVLPGWITSGQWGHDVLFVFVIAAGATLILTRAKRLDTALAFLVGALFWQVLRAAIFGFRPEVVAHYFESGALWLFALYMITDPRTTPATRGARIVHAVLVAGVAVVMLQFFYVRDSFLWSLLILSPLVPFLGGLNAQPRLAEAR